MCIVAYYTASVHSKMCEMSYVCYSLMPMKYLTQNLKKYFIGVLRINERNKILKNRNFSLRLER